MNFDLILLDIETQRDFFDPAGSCYTSQAESARKNVHRLFRWARQNQQPVISTVLRVPPGRIGPLAPVPHCIEDTYGEEKLPRTIIKPYRNLGIQNTTDLPEDLLDTYRQIIFEKRHPDIFTHQRAERLITEMSRVSFVVCGAGVADGIVNSVVGLRSRGFGVILAMDAVVDLGNPGADMAYRRMMAKGVVFTRTREITVPHPKRAQAKPFRQVAETLTT